MSTEREDWLALQTHPGYLRLLAYARSQWGGMAYKQKIKSAMATAQVDKTDMATAIQVIDAVSDEVNALLSYPQERVKVLEELAAKEASNVTPMSRRGSL